MQTLALASTDRPSPVDRSAATFLLGQNVRGQWVIKETHGRMEGVFVQRKDAIRFALDETGLPHAAVIATPDVVEMEALR